MTTKNDITGDSIKSKSTNENYRKGFDLIQDWVKPVENKRKKKKSSKNKDLEGKSGK